MLRVGFGHVPTSEVPALQAACAHSSGGRSVRLQPVLGGDVEDQREERGEGGEEERGVYGVRDYGRMNAELVAGFPVWKRNYDLRVSSYGPEPEKEKEQGDEMTYEKVVSVMKMYRVELVKHKAVRAGADKLVWSGCGECRLCHVKWMLMEMMAWGPERLGKMFRWLGFIQGVLWAEGVYTIEEMKEHNRSDVEESKSEEQQREERTARFGERYGVGEEKAKAMMENVGGAGVVVSQRVPVSLRESLRQLRETAAQRFDEHYNERPLAFDDVVVDRHQLIHFLDQMESEYMVYDIRLEGLKHDLQDIALRIDNYRRSVRE
jgi:hypothetical protein